MQIAELFINLGVKGSEKTIGAIAGLQKGLKETASTSLEAKAAIVGAMYALERLFATSGQVGTDLTNFNALMGGGMTQTLQRYQYAARQVGISNQELSRSFVGLTELSTNTLLGKTKIAGAAYVADRTKTDLNPLLLAASQGHPEQLLQKLQEFAQHNELSAGFRNNVLKSFGLSDNMVAGLVRGAFSPANLNAAPTYSDKELGQLDKANIAWSNLGNKIEMAIGHLNAKFGPALVKDITQIVDKLIPLGESLVKLGEALHVVEGIKKAFDGWSIIIKAITDGVKEITGLLDDPKWAEKLEKLGIATGKGAAELGAEAGREGLDAFAEANIAADKGGTEANTLIGTMISILTKLVAPSFAKPDAASAAKYGPKLFVVPPSPTASALSGAAKPPVPAGAPGSTQNVEVNQTLQFHHDGTDAKKTGDSVQKAVTHAFRQQYSQAQGS